MTENQNKKKFWELRKKAEEIGKERVESFSHLDLSDMKSLVAELNTYHIELELQNEELRHIQAELEATKDRYFQIYNLAPISYFVLNEQSLILETNLSGASLLGIEIGFLRKKPFNIYIAAGYQSRFLNHLKKVFGQQGQDVCELALKRRDGSTRIIEMKSTLAKREVEGGIQSVCLCAVEDITEQKKAGESLQKAHDELEVRMREISEKSEELKAANAELVKTSRMKTQFVANMNHELLTPMNAIIGMADLLGKTSLDADQKGFVETIRTSSEMLLRLIRDILDFSRIESEKLHMEMNVFNLNNTVSKVVDMLSVAALDKGLSIHFTRNETLPKYVKGDAKRISQVLVNLVNNSIKFTEKGNIFIRLEKIEERHNLAVVKIIVQDEGIGIEQNFFSEIFKSFSQADMSTTRKYGGAGMGLAISKELVEMMSGSIEVDSQPGKGAEFSVILPFEISESSEESLPEEAGASPENQKESSASTYVIPESARNSVRILVVEDNLINQRLAQSMLTNSGYYCDVVENGEIAVRQLSTHPYDLILMDIQMPVMDGIEATKIIRDRDSSVRDHSIPIVAMTAHTAEEDRERCIQAGMDDYIAKPIKPEQLKEVIGIHLFGKTRQEASPFAGGPAEDKRRKVFDNAEMRHRVADDEGLMRTLLELFPGNMAKEMDILRRALSQKDMETVRFQAHSIKGMVVNISAHRLSDIAYAMDRAGKNEDINEIRKLYPELKKEFENFLALLFDEGYIDRETLHNTTIPA